RQYQQLAQDTASALLIENNYGPGTACSHWDEEQLKGELMTGVAQPESPRMPLSVITIGAMADLGYAVDYGAADPFTLPSDAVDLGQTEKMTSPAVLSPVVSSSSL
ncbi:unnamed protein product, partial [Phaeothamnion confervicola]